MKRNFTKVKKCHSNCVDTVAESTQRIFSILATIPPLLLYGLKWRGAKIAKICFISPAENFNKKGIYPPISISARILSSDRTNYPI